MFRIGAGVNTGLKTTFEALATSRNEAATALLLPALDADEPAVQEGALEALLIRRGLAGQQEILRRLPTANERWRAIIRRRPDGLRRGLREALLSADPSACENACRTVLWLRDYDLFPALVNALETDDHPHIERIAATLLELADQLYEELALPRDATQARDPEQVRRHVLASLEGAVQQFLRHQRREVLEAFLVLAPWDNDVLRQLLADPWHPSFLATVEVLAHSGRPGVIRQVLSSLDDPQPCTAVLGVLARRDSRKFVAHLLRKIGKAPSAAAVHNLKRVEALRWPRPAEGMLANLDEQEQHSVVQLLVASGVKRGEVLETLEYLARHGQPAGRRAALEALGEFNGALVNQLRLAALNDGDPFVQAAAIRQLRARGIPGALSRMIELADSPHETVREAVRESLTEFRFNRFLAAFDMLDEAARRSTGGLVRKIDDQTVPLLSAELRSPVRTRRLRAIAVTIAMNAAVDVPDELCELLADDDHLVRCEAARALAACDSRRVRATLADALFDDSPPVRAAAQATLDELDGRAAASGSISTKDVNPKEGGPAGEPS